MSDRLSLRSSTNLVSSHVATLQSGTCHVAWRRATTDSRRSMRSMHLLPIQISLLIPPVQMMAVKVSNQDCRIWKDWWQICVILVFSWWFVDVGNVIFQFTEVFSLIGETHVVSAHTNEIAPQRRRHTRSIRDVAANICLTSMFGMDVPTPVDTQNFIQIHARLFE